VGGEAVVVKINLPLVITVLAALGGIAGTVLTPIYGAQLTTAVQGVLQAISALLVLLPVHHASSIVVSQSRARIFAESQAGYRPG
jgi:hypothetical protein